MQYRTQHDSGAWGPWLTAPRNLQFVENLNREYRVAPEKQCCWQKEREAWLAGKRVEFRSKSSEWTAVDSWVEGYCRENRDGMNTPLFERDWLTFRVKD